MVDDEVLASWAEGLEVQRDLDLGGDQETENRRGQQQEGKEGPHWSLDTDHIRNQRPLQRKEWCACCFEIYIKNGLVLVMQSAHILQPAAVFLRIQGEKSEKKIEARLWKPRTAADMQCKYQMANKTSN